jgi:NCAIR mutase (PurE)-related protein
LLQAWPSDCRHRLATAMVNIDNGDGAACAALRVINTCRRFAPGGQD